MFIIYNTFAIAVTQRRSEIGILRALGATRAQIRTLFLAESAIAGLVGTARGRGVRHRRWRAPWRATSAGCSQDVYGIAQSAEDIEIEPWLIRAAVAMGVVTSLIAAVIPGARGGVRRSCEGVAKGPLSIVERRRKPRPPPLGDRVRGRFGGRACCSAAIASSSTRDTCSRCWRRCCSRPRWRCGWRARCGRCSRWMRPVEGTLAADSLIQAPRRTSGTVAALMLSLALVISLGGLARVELRFDFRLDADRAQSRSVRHHGGKPHRRAVSCFRRRWATDCERSKASAKCSWCAACACW